MATLYTLHLSRHVKGFGKPSVKAVPGMIAGTLCETTRDIVKPDVEAVRDALPHYYRKALDRGGSFWFPADGKGNAYVTLRDSRGRYLNTVYAIPYTFNPA